MTITDALSALGAAAIVLVLILGVLAGTLGPEEGVDE